VLRPRAGVLEDPVRRGRGRARARPSAAGRRLEPRRAREASASRLSTATMAAKRRRVREPDRPEPAVRARVGGEEDDRVRDVDGGLDGRHRPRVGPRELEQRRGPARVVVRARPDAGVVPVGHDHDRVLGLARRDGPQVPQPDPAEAGDVLAPAVAMRREPVGPELLLEPARARRTGRAGAVRYRRASSSPAGRAPASNVAGRRLQRRGRPDECDARAAGEDENVPR
jgi:hypothetical protein